LYIRFNHFLIEWRRGGIQEVNFKTNNFDNVLAYKIKETDVSKTGEGENYEDVLVVEAERKMMMNGNLMSIHFFTSYYYAVGVGLILTTLSMGGNITDEQALVDYKLNEYR
jgi:hypothetical protein